MQGHEETPCVNSCQLLDDKFQHYGRPSVLCAGCIHTMRLCTTLESMLGSGREINDQIL